MYQINEFEQRELLDEALADKVAALLTAALDSKGKASIAVSGGSTPKGFFQALSKKKLAWEAITITLADERWVDIDSSDSNTKLVHEYLMQNEAVKAKFFYLKQGEILSDETLTDLNLAANQQLLPLDVLILGMGEDGHTASLFPCSDEITQCLAKDSQALLKVTPKTAPHQRISFSFAALAQSKNTFLHISGISKKQVLAKAIAGQVCKEMPIRAFLQAPNINTQVYWAK
ncbi:6-phosphogluconolactonase [Colwellia sp. MB02u-18]|uniref:6-phosphogluconolactonase n=1 Tax=unclassified Colwellia TaxID=196834 RepID=UPI0015F54B55|nr:MULTISPECIES: 6-phosphogluconolactonase [unclassified Colwellia]MBA6224844.1 6-phosphogluconolactonase [Colwellia sp. MB3u-45]MBA6268868.1 6-phosphogluconolactonase [Colwellia sp. MB3u-43]MBA6321299.1 6-phosphogluconolactonase [Colwellia sp. MB02u-19]MBA6325852.1 6-phosphogluconolactonase [Colwellia sp. MB02u-18]MBA6332327.1 6-phosphogluconolactonase [Colwellia sp. MB02u-12]